MLPYFIGFGSGLIAWIACIIFNINVHLLFATVFGFHVY